MAPSTAFTKRPRARFAARLRVADPLAGPIGARTRETIRVTGSRTIPVPGSSRSRELSPAALNDAVPTSELEAWTVASMDEDLTLLRGTAEESRDPLAWLSLAHSHVRAGHC